MENLSLNDQEILFSQKDIEQQLQRIFLDSHFTESEILKKFLSFIVHETLEGHSNRLKEYTIAINVLEKPAGFKPWENGIVRIHAGRLRRALSQYYREKGVNDPIIITMPKGKYVPCFTDRMNDARQTMVNESSVHFKKPSFIADEASITLAILPFICPEKKDPGKSFAEGLCLQMSSALVQFDQISVVAYHAIKNLLQTHPDYRELATSVGFNHILTGATQYLKDKIRVNIEIIECHSFRQVWSEIFERKLTKSNLFDVQDEICQIAVNKVGELGSRKHQGKYALPMLSAI